MASLFSEALDFALTKAGKDSDFKLKTEQKSIIEAVVDIFTPFARTVTFVKNFLQILRSTQGPRCIFAIGGLNKMPKAFLMRTAGASVLGRSGSMLPRKIFKINASRMAKNTSQYSRQSELFYYLSG